MAKDRRHAIVLPPPVGVILLYAADGLAVSRGQLSTSGKPRTPSREQWVPMFRQLLESADGLATLHDLAKAGMQAWTCPASFTQCLNAAVRDITFRALTFAALEDLADTAHQRFTLQTSPPPKATAPVPLVSPRPAPESAAPTMPPRPGQRPRGRPRPPSP